jgi:quinol---cytochrome c reductase iron-sulfur subunit, bacillus type
MSVERQSRRTFYVSLINLLGAAIAAALAIPSAAYLLLRPKGEGQTKWIELGEVSKLKVGEPEELVFKRQRVDGWQKVVEKASAWVVRTDQNQVVAFSPLCTHLGCPYHWEQSVKTFVCPCHSSLFAVDGKVLGGPAARPLDRYVSKVEDGKILITPRVEQSNG